MSPFQRVWKYLSRPFAARAAGHAREPRRARPQLEGLEGRLTPTNWIVLGTGVNVPTRVELWDKEGDTNTLLGSFQPFGTTFRGGARVALGEIDGDANPEIFVAPGPGGKPVVNIYDFDT